MDLSAVIAMLPAKTGMAIALALFVVAHAIAMGIIPAPKVGATGAWAKIFTVLNTISANYGAATSIPDGAEIVAASAVLKAVVPEVVPVVSAVVASAPVVSAAPLVIKP